MSYIYTSGTTPIAYSMAQAYILYLFSWFRNLSWLLVTKLEN
jgi:hypothetical protein